MELGRTFHQCGPPWLLGGKRRTLSFFWNDTIYTLGRIRWTQWDHVLRHCSLYFWPMSSTALNPCNLKTLVSFDSLSLTSWYLHLPELRALRLSGHGFSLFKKVIHRAFRIKTCVQACRLRGWKILVGKAWMLSPSWVWCIGLMFIVHISESP